MNQYIHSIRVCLTFFILLFPMGGMASSNEHYPLEPLDLSTPGATIKNFLLLGDDILGKLAGEYWYKPNRKDAEQMWELATQVERTLDLHELPPASRFEQGRDASLYLYEVLSRIELPSDDEYPDPTVFETKKTDENDKHKKKISWTIPHTDITLKRIEEGPGEGNFVFSLETILNAEKFYEKTRTLPYRRNVPLENYAEKRHYLSPGGLMIPSSVVESFPEWLKYSINHQAVWKWFALFVLSFLALIIIVFIHRFSQKTPISHSNFAKLRSLATPLILLLFAPMLVYFVNRELLMIGTVSQVIAVLSEAVFYLALAWFLWTGIMVIADIIIAKSRIQKNSIHAQIMWLVARSLSIVAVIVIFFYVSSQLGAPLYSLFAGLGVGGLAIALATQGSIENLIGGLNLFADQPVRVGDFCRYGEDSNLDLQRVGTVISIGLRSTRIRGIDSSLTVIPNADFAKMHIVNYTLRNRMLLLSVLGFRYETTDDQLRFVIVNIRDMLLGHPRVVDEEPRVRFCGFGDYSLNVEIRVDLNTSDRDEFRAIREDIFLRIIPIVKQSGTGFAFPSRTIYHADDEGMDAEHQQEAEKTVRSWCSAQELPFPNFSNDYRHKTRNTLDFPPEGSPEGSKN